MKVALALLMVSAVVAMADVPVPRAATQAEVNAGVLNSPYVTPLTLANWTGAGGGSSNAVLNNQATVNLGSLTNSILTLSTNGTGSISNSWNLQNGFGTLTFQRRQDPTHVTPALTLSANNATVQGSLTTDNGVISSDGLGDLSVLSLIGVTALLTNLEFTIPGGGGVWTNKVDASGNLDSYSPSQTSAVMSQGLNGTVTFTGQVNGPSFNATGTGFSGNAAGTTNLANGVPVGTTTNFLANIGGSGLTVGIPLSSLPFGSGGGGTPNAAITNNANPQIFSGPQNLTNTANVIAGNIGGATNYPTTNLITSAGTLAAASAATNFTVNLLPGEAGNIQHIYLANTNVFASFTGTNLVDYGRTVIFDALTNSVISTLTFNLPRYRTNSTSAGATALSLYVTNGYIATFNFYNLDATGSNVMVSDAGRWK